MEPLNQVLEEHRALLERLQKAEETEQFVAEIERFAGKLQSLGAEVGDPQEREMLRSLLRYWGSQIYELTGTYPRFELLPYTAPAPSPEEKAIKPSEKRGFGRLVAFISLIGLVLLVGLFLTFLTKHPIFPLRVPTPTLSIEWITPSPFLLTPMPSKKIFAVLLSETPVRATPDSTSPELFLASRNLLVEVIAAKGDKWLLVKFGDFQGWVERKSLKLKSPLPKSIITPGSP